MAIGTAAARGHLNSKIGRQPLQPPPPPAPLPLSVPARVHKQDSRKKKLYTRQLTVEKVSRAMPASRCSSATASASPFAGFVPASRQEDTLISGSVREAWFSACNSAVARGPAEGPVPACLQEAELIVICVLLGPGLAAASALPPGIPLLSPYT